MSVQRIPLSGGPERFSITLADATYRMRVAYANAPRAGWLLDISDENDQPILAGLPMLPGLDLLDAYRHLMLGFSLFIKNTEDDFAPPSYEALGSTAFLLAVVP